MHVIVKSSTVWLLSYLKVFFAPIHTELDIFLVISDIQEQNSMRAVDYDNYVRNF